MNILINIILLNWDSIDDITQSLGRLQSISKSQGCNSFRVLVINNNNNYNISKFIKKSDYVFDLRLTDTNSNLGYAGGNNEALKFLVRNGLNGDLLVVNPDVEFDDSFIDKVNCYAGLYPAFMVSASDREGKLLYNKIKMKGLFQSWEVIHDPNDMVLTDYLAGSCFYISRELSLMTNLFDESFFLYWEEVDLSFRLRLLNTNLYSSSEYKVIRNENSDMSIINSQFYLMRNVFYVYRKHTYLFSLFDVVKYLNVSIIKNIAMSIKFKKIKPIKLCFKGIFKGLFSSW